MNLMDLFIKVGVDDQASAKVSSLSSKLEKGLGTAAKIGTAAVTAAGTAIVKLAKDSVSAYAQYEQLEGGIKKLFGQESMKTVLANADMAYKTAGMSANKYLETTTSFAASLIAGLDGDTAKAAEYADMAIRDMSDNANTFGTDISMIQNAYQGFAKQNYTMLDNLRLGYGGTASEMARLINDSGVLGETVTVTASNINRVSFDKIVEAIHKVQDEMVITGTTMTEAEGTIKGSIEAVKASWENLLTAMINDPDSVGEKFDLLAENIGTAWGNIEPSLSAFSESFEKLYREEFPGLSSAIDVLSPLVSGLAAAFVSFKGIQNAITLFNTLKTVIAGGAALSTGGIIAIGIGAIIASLVAFIKLMKDEESRKAVTDFWQGVADAVNSTPKGFVQTLVENELNALSGILPYLSEEQREVIDAKFGRILAAYGITTESDLPDINDSINNLFEHMDDESAIVNGALEGAMAGASASILSPEEIANSGHFYPIVSEEQDYKIERPLPYATEKDFMSSINKIAEKNGFVVSATFNFNDTTGREAEEIAEEVVTKLQQMIDGKEAAYD